MFSNYKSFSCSLNDEHSIWKKLVRDCLGGGTGFVLDEREHWSLEQGGVESEEMTGDWQEAAQCISEIEAGQAVAGSGKQDDMETADTGFGMFVTYMKEELRKVVPDMSEYVVTEITKKWRQLSEQDKARWELLARGTDQGRISST